MTATAPLPFAPAAPAADGRRTVLVVEDNPVDARLIARALREAVADVEVVVVDQARACLTMLRGPHHRREPVRPDLILLDLRLPGRDGQDLLAELKGDAELRRIPVVVLTGADSHADVYESYDSQANGFVRKRSDPGELARAIVSLARFWLTSVVRPTADGGRGAARRSGIVVGATPAVLGEDASPHPAPGIRWGWTVVETLDEAFARLDEAGADLLAVALPADGLRPAEVMLAIRERAPDLPVVVAVSQGEEPLAAEAMDAGADAWLVDGVPGPGVLGSVLLHALERRTGARALAESERLATVGRLAASVAHEVNNPLAAILSTAETLLLDARTAHERESLETIRDEAKRAHVILRDLFALARTRVTARAEHDVAELLGTVQRIVRAQARAAGVRVELDVPDGADALGAVVVDAAGIEQVLINLVRNAMQATGTGGAVTLAARRTAGECTIAVEDDGPGIAPEHLAHVFRPFFTTRGSEGGNGLGLAVCTDIARRHGGTLRAENRMQGGRIIGARFVLVLPARPAGARP